MASLRRPGVRAGGRPLDPASLPTPYIQLLYVKPAGAPSGQTGMDAGQTTADPPVDDEAFFSGCKRGGRVGRTPPLDDGMDSLTPPPSKRRPPAPSRTTEFGRLNVVERPELFVSHMVLALTTACILDRHRRVRSMHDLSGFHNFFHSRGFLFRKFISNSRASECVC